MKPRARDAAILSTTPAAPVAPLQALVTQWRWNADRIDRGGEPIRVSDSTAYRECADELDALLSASPGSPLEQEDELHTGDDDLLDTLTSIRAGVDDLLDAEDGICEEARDTLRSLLDELTKADQLRVAELKSASPGSPWRPKDEKE